MVVFLSLMLNVCLTYIIYQPQTKILDTLRGTILKYEPRHEISNNVVCVTSKGSDQPAHTRRLIRAFAGRLIILRL